MVEMLLAARLWAVLQLPCAQLVDLLLAGPMSVVLLQRAQMAMVTMRAPAWDGMVDSQRHHLFLSFFAAAVTPVAAAVAAAGETPALLTCSQAVLISGASSEYAPGMRKTARINAADMKMLAIRAVAASWCMQGWKAVTALRREND